MHYKLSGKAELSMASCFHIKNLLIKIKFTALLTFSRGSKVLTNDGSESLHLRKGEKSGQSMVYGLRTTHKKFIKNTL